LLYDRSSSDTRTEMCAGRVPR